MIQERLRNQRAATPILALAKIIGLARYICAATDTGTVIGTVSSYPPSFIAVTDSFGHAEAIVFLEKSRS
jgi:hypothetical protein